ncbi:MAG TPA: esterase [Deltaproteobacteria bacterium]|nr:esterase [Deltaproteobacteria bacterium]
MGREFERQDAAEVFVQMLWIAALGAALSVQVRPAPAVVATLTHAGLERSFHVTVPESAAPGAPLVLALHGRGGRGERLDRVMGHRLSAEAQERGWVLVTPEGHNNGWNDGRPVTTRRGGAREAVDDVGFLDALVNRLAADGTIDPERVFVVGMSNGGQLAYRLAAEHPERFHTIAPMISNLPTTLADHTLDSPVSVLVMNGTADPVVPYDGGTVEVFGQARGQVLSTEATIRWWADRNHCTGSPATQALEDRDPSDGTRIFVQSLQSCEGGVEVTLVKVQGGGHTWPGGPQYLPRRMVGTVSQDADAVGILYRFFTRQIARLDAAPEDETPL